MKYNPNNNSTLNVITDIVFGYVRQFLMYFVGAFGVIAAIKLFW